MTTRLSTLYDKRASILDAMEAAVTKAEKEDRDFTEDEVSAYDAQKADLASVKNRIARDEALNDEERGAASIEPGAAPTPTLRSLEPDGFETLGLMLQAVANAETAGQVDPRLFAATGMSESVPSDGGFLIDKPLANRLVEKMHETGRILSLVVQQPIGPNSNGLKWRTIDESSRKDGSRWGGVRGYWVNEGTAPTASKPKIGREEMSLEKVAALMYATDELMADSVALTGLVDRVVPAELVFKVEDAFMNGDGAGKPKGILQAASLVSVAKEGSQAADTVVYDNVTNMWSRLFAPLRTTAVWHVNQDVEPELLNMVVPGGGGVPAYLPPGGLSVSPFSTLFGRPVIPVEYCATLGDKGDIVLTDWSSYLSIAKGGVETATSIHVKFIEDEVAFRFTYRINGQSEWNKPLTPFKGSNTLSAHVTLDART